jgi:hypothetical protein
MSWLFAPFAVLLGVVLTTQVATNALLGKALGNDYIPAAVNMAIGLVATAALTWSLTSEWPSRESRAMVRLVCWRHDGNDIPHRKYSSCPTAWSRRVGWPRRRRPAYFLGSTRPFRLDRFCAAFREPAAVGRVRVHDRRRFSDCEILSRLVYTPRHPIGYQTAVSRPIKCPSGSRSNAR